MNARPSVMIVIGQVLIEPWLGITQRGQFPTWLRDAQELGIPVRHSHGRRSTRTIQALDRWHEWARWTGRGRTLIPRIDSIVGKPWRNRIPSVSTGSFLGPDSVAWQQSLTDVYALQRWKILGSMSQALKEDFDFVYFTTASSYVRISVLLDHVRQLPTSGAYAGTIHVDAISGVRFASGANRIFSRDVIETVVRERTRYRNDVMEDVGLGRLLREFGIDVVGLPSLDVPSADVLHELSDREILENFHFRMTSGTREQRNDVKLMHALHDRVVGLERASGIRNA